MIEVAKAPPSRNGDDAEARISGLSSELESARTQLREARRTVAANGLAGQIAHDFSNLLGVIIANLDLLDEQIGAEPDLAPLVRDALEAALRGAQLTRQLLALSHREPLAPARVAINDMLARLGDAVRPAATAVEIRLKLDALATHVTADPMELEACLDALLRRGCAAMPQGGRLQISTAGCRLGGESAALAVPLSGEYVVVEISDTGTALTPEAVASALSPTLSASAQPDAAISELHLVSSFARQSHGYVDVHAEPGLGTTIRLYLPRGVEQAPATGEDPAAVADSVGSETVLVVDDNPDMRRVVARQLKELGYTVIEAEDGPTALMTLNGESVDLLFTDVVMPGGLSGFDLARLVLSRWPKMKALITSGFPELEPHGDSAPQAKLRRLYKPYRKSDLAKVLREVLDA